MRKRLAITLLAVLSTAAVAEELPLGLSTPVVGSVTLAQTLLVGSAIVAAAAAASSSGGNANGGGTTGTTGTTGTGN